MILDLTTHLTEKSFYKVPRQRDAWGYLPYFWSHYSSLLFSRELLENVFLRGKRRTDSDLIYQLGKPYLRISKLLACWNQLGGIRIKTRKIFGSWLGGTWYFPSDSVIYIEGIYAYELLMLGN